MQSELFYISHILLYTHTNCILLANKNIFLTQIWFNHKRGNSKYWHPPYLCNTNDMTLVTSILEVR